MREASRWRSLRHRRLQSAFAISAIAAAVSLPVILISVGGGVSAHELHAIENAGYQIVVSAAGIHGINDAHSLATQIAAIGSVAAVSPVLSVSIDAFVGSGGPTPVLAEGVIPQPFEQTLAADQRPLFPSPLPLGDPFDTLHFANGSYAGPITLDVLVSSPIAQNLGVTVGSTIVLSPNTDQGVGVRYQVTGIFGVAASLVGPTSAYVIVLPLSNLQQFTGYAQSSGSPRVLIDAADTIQVALTSTASTDPSAIQAVGQAITQLAPFYVVDTLLQQAQQLQNQAAVLTGFYLALSSVALSVGLIFLAIILLRRVENQRASIGIRRAIGIPGWQIGTEMAGYGLTLAGAGSLAGLVGGILLVTTLAQWGSQTVAQAARLAVFDPVTLGALVAGVLGLSLLASAVATRAALRISIPETLR